MAVCDGQAVVVGLGDPVALHVRLRLLWSDSWNRKFCRKTLLSWLKRKVKKRPGMAHLKNITHFFVINYCFEDTQMLKSDLNLDIRLGLVLNDSSFNCCCRRGRIIFLMAVAANRSNMTWHFLSDVMGSCQLLCKWNNLVRKRCFIKSHFSFL